MMTGVLRLEIESFSELHEHGDQNVCRDAGYKIRLVIDNRRILFEETLPRGRVPLDPTKYLAERVARILVPYLPQIDPNSL